MQSKSREIYSDAIKFMPLAHEAVDVLSVYLNFDYRTHMNRLQYNRNSYFVVPPKNLGLFDLRSWVGAE